VEIEKLSASRLKTYWTCPMRYFYRYAEGLIIPPSSALSLGSAFHESLGFNYQQKIESRQDLKESDVLDFFSTDFDERAHETLWFPNEDKGEVKDSGVRIIKVYQKDVAPKVQPVAVEHQFALLMRRGQEQLAWFFEGHVDVIDEKGVIKENKTTSRTPKQANPADMLQTCAYSQGYRADTGEIEQAVEIDYAVKLKSPKIVSFSRQVERSEIEFFNRLMNQIVRGIEQEFWIPNRQSIMCTRRACGYWQVCERDWKGRVKD
jgi:putative RecB family exonuclease